jgi:hypothetical protein
MTIKDTVAGRLPVAYVDDDDEVEIIETPAPAVRSSKSRKKVTHGTNEQAAHNIAQTRDGEFLDIDTVLNEDKEQSDSDDAATATRKGKEKPKPQVNAPVMSKTKPKSKPKGKSKATADGELDDVEKSHSLDVYIDCECHLNIVRLATQLNLHSKSKWHKHSTSCHYHRCVKQWSHQEAS